MFKAAGAITDDELLTFRKFGSRLEGHPTPVLPWVDVATGSLGQGLPYGVGIALAGKRLDKIPYRIWVLCGDSEMAEGSMWEAFEHAWHEKLDNLVAIIDVNRLGQRGETMHGWDLDSYAKRAEAFGWHAIEIDGHDVEAIDQAYREAEETTGLPTVIVAKTIKGKGVKAVENKEGFHGKALDDPEEAIEELGGIRNIEIEVAKPEGERPNVPPSGGGAVELPAYEVGGDEVATRKAYGDALKALGDARGGRGRARRRGLELDLRGDLPRRATRSGTSRCTSPSSRWSPRRSGSRCAAGSRSRRASPRSSRARTTSSGWPRSAARTSSSAARTQASRSARTAHRRWRSRIWPPSGRCTARPCCTRATRTRRPSSSRPWPTSRGSSSCARLARTRRSSTSLDEEFPVGGARVVRSSDDDDVTLIGAGITLHESVKAADSLAEQGVTARVIDLYSVKPIDEETLRAAAEATGLFVVAEDHWPEGGLAEAVLSVFADADERPRVEHLAVREMPGSGKPAELLAAAGIDAEHIASAARKLVEAGVRA